MLFSALSEECFRGFSLIRLSRWSRDSTGLGLRPWLLWSHGWWWRTRGGRAARSRGTRAGRNFGRLQFLPHFGHKGPQFGQVPQFGQDCGRLQKVPQFGQVLLFVRKGLSGSNSLAAKFVRKSLRDCGLADWLRDCGLANWLRDCGLANPEGSWRSEQLGDLLAERQLLG